MRKSLLTVLLVMTAVFVAKAQKCIVIDEVGKEFQTKHENLYLFLDSSNVLTINEIEILDSKNWLNDFSFLADNPNLTYWIKFCVKGSAEINNKYVVEVYDWQLQEFELFSKNKAGQFSAQKKGSIVEFRERDFKTFNLIYELDTDYEGEKVFYARVKSKRHGFLNFRLRKVSYSTSYAVSEYFFLGIFYGFVLLMLALNVFLWISTTERIYGFYVLFILTLAFQSSLIDGTGFQYIWNQFPKFTYWSLDVSKLLVLIAFFFYVCEMLKLNPKNFWYRIWLFSVVLYGVWHLAFISGQFNMSFNGWFLMVPYSVALAVVAKSFIKQPKNKSFNLFFIGVLCFYVGILFVQLRDMGNTQWMMLYESFEIIANYAVNFAILIELVLFSFALSHRFAKQKSAEIETSQMLILELKKNEALKEEINKTLEEKVMSRTAELQEKSSKLEMLNIELENITSVVAHDLRTPLNRVKGLAELVKLSGDLNKEQNQMIEMVFKTVKESEHLISNLLELRKYDNGQAIEITNVNLDFLFEKIKLGFFQDLERKNLKLLIENGTGITILSNEAILTRVLENLVSNSIKFSESFKNIFLTARTDDEHVEIVVQDQGLGFDENDKKQVFGKFSKLSSRPTMGESSNGLGLNIVKNLIEKLKGEISLESEKGKGSRFVIKLPLNHI